MEIEIVCIDEKKYTSYDPTGKKLDEYELQFLTADGVLFKIATKNRYSDIYRFSNSTGWLKLKHLKGFEVYSYDKNEFILEASAYLSRYFQTDFYSLLVKKIKEFEINK